MARWIPLRRIALVAFVLVLVTGACAGGEDDASAGDAGAFGTAADEADMGEPTPPTDASEDGGGSDADPGDRLGSGGVAQVALQTQTAGRQIIFTADMTIAVTDVAAAGEEATRVIEGLGGFLFGQQTRGLPEPQSTLTFKIAPDRFQEALTRLGSIGELRSQNVSADDVTERIVDLQSRITTAEASVTRLRELIAEAVGIEAITALESQLLQRETDLETMRGQLRTLRDRVDLATIVVTVTEALSRPELYVEVSAYPGHADAGQSCPGDGGIQVDEGDDVTVCFEITNVGDMPLTGFDVRDPVLEVEMDDLLVVFGDPAATIEPGQFLILAAEIAPERSFRSQTRVTAAPVNADGEVLENRRVSSTSAVFVEAVDPGGLPGFGDGLSAGLDFLRNVGGLAVLALGTAIPFLWVPVVAWLAIRWRRRRATASQDEPPPDAGSSGGPEARFPPR